MIPGYAIHKEIFRGRKRIVYRGERVIPMPGFPFKTGEYDIRNFFFAQKQLRSSMASDIEDFQWGLEQIHAGRIKPLLDRVLPLNEAAEAHRLIAANQVAGNIVLMPWAA